MDQLIEGKSSESPLSRAKGPPWAIRIFFDMNASLTIHEVADMCSDIVSDDDDTSKGDSLRIQ